jgi:hypothetical protein
LDVSKQKPDHIAATNKIHRTRDIFFDKNFDWTVLVQDERENASQA